MLGFMEPIIPQDRFLDKQPFKISSTVGVAESLVPAQKLRYNGQSSTLASVYDHRGTASILLQNGNRLLQRCDSVAIHLSP
jgi:hypothetical protein